MNNNFLMKKKEVNREPKVFVLYRSCIWLSKQSDNANIISN